MSVELWQGIIAATTPDYGDVVLAEYTQTFDRADVTYYDVLVQWLLLTLPEHVRNPAADAAFDAWYVYEDSAQVGGVAAIPLKAPPQQFYPRDQEGLPVCPRGWRMKHSASINDPRGYRSHHSTCPVFAQPPELRIHCDHERFATGGCCTEINAERGGMMRVTLDRSTPLYRGIYARANQL